MKTIDVLKCCSAVFLLILLNSQIGFSQNAVGRLVLSDATFSEAKWENFRWDSPDNEFARLRLKNPLSVANYSLTFTATSYGPTQGPSPSDRISFFFGQDNTQENYYELTYFPTIFGGGPNIFLTKILSSGPNVTLGSASRPPLENDEVYTWQVIKEAQSGRITVNLDRGDGNGLDYVIGTTDTSIATLGHFGWTRNTSAPKLVTIQQVEVRDILDASRVVSFTLVNAATGQPIPGFNPIPANAVIDPIKLPAFSIRANTGPAKVGSVRFAYDGLPEWKVENLAPYSISGDFNNGTRYNPFLPAPGVQTLTATPFAGADLTGTLGTARSLSFTVKYTFEAENASPSFQGFPRVTDENAGFSGTGYMDYGNNFEEYIQWDNINIPVNNGPDTFTLTFRYANGGISNRPLNLTVNGGSPIRLSFPPTGSWTSWSTVSVDVPLFARGSISTVRNHFRLIAVNSTGPNIDYLQIGGVGAGATVSARTAEAKAKQVGKAAQVLGEAKGLLVYPNPAVQQLTLQVVTELKEAKLYNSVGQLVYTQTNLSPGVNQLSVDHLPSDIYILKVVTTAGERASQRVIIGH